MHIQATVQNRLVGNIRHDRQDRTIRNRLISDITTESTTGRDVMYTLVAVKTTNTAVPNTHQIENLLFLHEK